MSCDELIRAFSNRGNRSGRLIKTQRPSHARVLGQSAEDCFRAAIDRSVRFDQLDGCRKIFARDFRKLCRDLRVLGRQVVNSVSSQLSPTANPYPAKVAIAVKNHEWLCRRIADMDAVVHGRTVTIKTTAVSRQWSGSARWRMTWCARYGIGYS